MKRMAGRIVTSAVCLDFAHHYLGWNASDDAPKSPPEQLPSHFRDRTVEQRG